MAVVIRSCLGVDIGSHSIRIASMERGKAGPRVVTLIEEKLSLEAGLTDAQRNQRIAKQIGDMLKREKIRTRNAVFCVPGQSVFVKRIKLPRTSEDRMARIIGFEARQQIPFPLEKTIMEYQIFQEEDAAEVNVLMVAIKRDYIMNFMRMVRRTGLRPLAISVSSLALFNFHELNNTTRNLGTRLGGGLLAGLTAKKDNKKGAKKRKGEDEEVSGGDEEAPLEAMGFEEIQAYVNLGASMMDLAIPKPGIARMIGFPRTVPLAGREMDRAIRDKLGIEDMNQAQQVKEESAVVLSSEFEIEGDAETVDMEASAAVTGVADRMISELRRSLDFYISQPDGVAVDSIVLSGGLARMKYLASYIEEKLGVPVELAEAKNPQLRMPDAPPDPFCPFAISVGLAAQGLGYAQNTIDFLPEDIKNVRGLQERRYEVALMIAMLVVIVLMSAGVGNTRIQTWQREIENYQLAMQQALKDNKTIKAAEERHKKVVSAYEQLAKASGHRQFWLRFLEVFDQNRSAEILVDDLRLRLDGNVIVLGRSPSQNSVTQFLESMKANKDLVKGAEINNIRMVSDRRFPANVTIWDFTLTIKTLARQGRIRSIGEQPVTRAQLLAEQKNELQEQNRLRQPNPAGRRLNIFGRQ